MAEEKKTPEKQTEVKSNPNVDAIKASFRQAVKGRIDGDMKHGWGVEDSLAVICDVAEQWAEVGADRINDDVFEAFQAAVREVVNPSQFRQKIEGTEEEVKKGKALLVKGETRKEKVKGMIDELIG